MGDVLAVRDTDSVTLGVREMVAVGVEVWEGEGLRLGDTLRDGTLAVTLGVVDSVGDPEDDSDTEGVTVAVEEGDRDGLGLFVDDLLLVYVAVEMGATGVRNAQHEQPGDTKQVLRGAPRAHTPLVHPPTRSGPGGGEGGGR